jgi:hypothetical protein
MGHSSGYSKKYVHKKVLKQWDTKHLLTKVIDQQQ